MFKWARTVYRLHSQMAEHLLALISPTSSDELSKSKCAIVTHKLQSSENKDIFDKESSKIQATIRLKAANMSFLMRQPCAGLWFVIKKMKILQKIRIY